MLSFTVGLGIGITAGLIIGIVIMSATAVYRITLLEKEIYICEEKIKELEGKKRRKKVNNG